MMDRQVDKWTADWHISFTEGSSQQDYLVSKYVFTMC